METLGEVLTKLWFFSHVFQASTNCPLPDCQLWIRAGEWKYLSSVSSSSPLCTVVGALLTPLLTRCWGKAPISIASKASTCLHLKFKIASSCFLEIGTPTFLQKLVWLFALLFRYHLHIYQRHVDVIYLWIFNRKEQRVLNNGLQIFDQLSYSYIASCLTHFEESWYQFVRKWGQQGGKAR